jgi:hypothetical protein
MVEGDGMRWDEMGLAVESFGMRYAAASWAAGWEVS